MAKFKVYAVLTYGLETEIEAEDEEQAWGIARNLDDQQFVEVKNSSDWSISEVREVA